VVPSRFCRNPQLCTGALGPPDKTRRAFLLHNEPDFERSPLGSISVQPSRLRSELLTIEIRALLADLMMPGPLLKRTGGGVIDGSGGGTRTPDPRIMIPVL
jgi:hypothetical protein